MYGWVCLLRKKKIMLKKKTHTTLGCFESFKPGSLCHFDGRTLQSHCATNPRCGFCLLLKLMLPTQVSLEILKIYFNQEGVEDDEKKAR